MKFITALAFTFLTSTTFASTGPTPTIPEVTPVVCSTTDYNEDQFNDFKVRNANLGGIVVQNTKDENRRIIVVDFGTNAADKPEQFYIVIFDKNDCYVDEAWVNEATLRDQFGIVIASE